MSRGLEADGVCDQYTWMAVVEAGFGSGDRLLYLTAPMLRGDDVADLQLRLGALGFDAGRVDGIFGPMTQRALSDFQQNIGLVCDQVCGPDTVSALHRLETRGGTTTVAGVREREELRSRVRPLLQLRVALGHRGGSESLLGPIAADLGRRGADIAMFSDDDWSRVAQQVNQFDADVCLALTSTAESECEVNYFETTGFVSAGGRRLAELIVHEMPPVAGWTLATLRGMRTPILRETRPPTVALRLGPTTTLIEHASLLAAALERSLDLWSTTPIPA